MKSNFHVLGMCAALALGVGTAWASDDPREVLEKVRKKFESVRDAEMKFTQRTRFSLSKLEQTVSGTLTMKKERKYRIETDDQTIVTDGTTVWSHSLANKQVLIDTFKDDERSLSPERILSGAKGDFAPTVLGREKVGKWETVVVRLVPRGDQSLVTSLRLWVDAGDWLIRKAEVIDVNGKETTYTVGEFRLNTGVPDSRFVFQIPPGVETVDLR
jgi:outer membrane lipoprotein-sorting protein